MRNLNYNAGTTGAGNQRIDGWEPYFNKPVWVGYIDHEAQTIRPAFGYFFPHKYGKRMKAKAKRMGYKFFN